MSLSQTEKMDLLLKQIKLSEGLVSNYFQNSRLRKLQVFTKTRRWHFHIEILKVLPVKVYEEFIHRIKQSFHTIAKVEVTFYTSDDEPEDQLLLDFWTLFLQKTNNLPPGLNGSLSKQIPEIKQNQVIITLQNEPQSVSLKRHLSEDFTRFCQRVGLPPVKLETRVERNNKDIKRFKEQQANEDKQIVKEIAKSEEIRKKNDSKVNELFIYGYKINDEPIAIENILEEEHRKTIQGYVFYTDMIRLRSGRSLLILKLTDYTDSLEIKLFSRNDEDEALFKRAKKGMWIKARGRIQTDMYSNQLVMMANDINEISVQLREDRAEKGKRRVELHAHTTMSQLDAVVSPAELVAHAAKWGHEAVAITDHSVVQAFPEAFYASQEHDIKVIYGLEANLVDDGVPIAHNVQDLPLEDQTFVVFDVETTGLSAVYDTIIEIAGVKIKNGEIIDQFESFANPHRPLPKVITEITGITDDMLVGAPEVDDVLQRFYDWIGGDILVAHNATFDIGFLNAGLGKIKIAALENAIIDTLELARFLFPELGNHRLNTLCNHLDVELTQHHRAIYDAEATGYLFWKFLKILLEKNISNHKELNNHIGEGKAYQHSRPFHSTILVKNEKGLKNLYKLVSESHINYFYRTPRIPRSLLQKHREGLLIGSGCNNGELFETMLQKSVDEAENVAQFYDYIEVQPPHHYIGLLERDVVQNEAQILDVIKNLVELGKRLEKPVVATGNVHYLEDHEKLYRRILIASQKGNPLNRQSLPDTPFYTTDEMLEHFKFLGEQVSKSIVVDNSQEIANQIERIRPLKKDLYTPQIEGAEEEVRKLVYKNAKKLYGESLPEIVEKRLEKELNSIIGHGFAVIYLISHKLVKRSLDDGYLVGSRGSVGSSLVATMTEITEVNPLPPHYVCSACKHVEFITDGSYASGFDLPDKTCASCDLPFIKDGQDIPFETFLGFEGDKVPDIDLNFSGEYQSKAHNYTKDLFGEEKVFRAGTIGTIAERTAYGYVRGYATDFNLHYRNAEIDRLVQGCTGVKRTTGQHPGGIIVVPDDMEIYDFTPIQFPADDRESEWKTTHFDFHSIEDNLLKLDILGHDDPTVIRMLQDLTEVEPHSIPIDDEKVMQLFSGTASIGVDPKKIHCQTGTLGVPEFGTQFVRQMLEQTKPKSFAELVIISGLSHGTDVWLGNAQDLINEGICELPDVIGCRDDIMVYLMQQGLDASLSFSIMESVRRGRGLQDEWITEMKKYNVPDWYIESCKKIKYMFPKAHAVAYVLMAVRIAYFKVYYPIEFYAAYFSVRARDFELDTMVAGADSLRERIIEIKEKGNDASPKERNLLTVLKVALEMNERGFTFQKVDLYRSDAKNFLVDGSSLIPPFNSVDGLGTNAALNIVKAREKGEFLSKQDLRERSRISKTVLDYLDQHGCLEGMEEENQLSLF